MVLALISYKLIVRCANVWSVMHDRPGQDRKVIRRAVVKLAVIRGVVAQAKKKLKEKNEKEKK